MIRVGDALTNIQIFERTLNDGYTIFYMEDGTLDMGSSFDIFDVVSHYDNPYIADEHRRNREYLKSVMESAGFAPYDQEWWHFRLRDEPYPSTYFDFEMNDLSNQGISVSVEITTLLVSCVVMCGLNVLI